MTCRNCGTEIATKALICYRCGTAVEELPGLALKAPKKRPVSLLGSVVVLIALLVAALLADRMFTPEVPRTLVWTVFVLAFILTVVWIARRRK
jgi:hypothetical protein